MQNTPRYSLPYPEGTDTPDMAYWTQRLAQAVEAVLNPESIGAAPAGDFSAILDAAQVSASTSEQAAEDVQTALQAVFATQDQGVADLIGTAAGPLTQAALDGRITTTHGDLLAALPRHYVTAHRTGASESPENTLAGIRHCIAAGVPLIEMDPRRTTDGHYVLMHDATVDRTTDGTGSVDALTLDQIKALDASSPFPGWPYREEVPTLKQALLACRDRAIPVLDIKNGAFLPDLIDIVRQVGMTDSVVACAGNSIILDEAKAAGWGTWLIANPSTISVAETKGYTIIGLSSAETDATFQDALATGCQVAMAGQTRRADRERAWALGVHGIATDYPRYMAAFTPLRTETLWSQGRNGDGAMALNLANGVPTLNDGAAVLSTYQAEIRPGDMMPVPMSSWTLSFEWRFSTAPNSMNEDLILDIGMTSDYPHSNSGSDWGASWELVVDGETSLRIYRIFDGSSDGLVVETPFAEWETITIGQWVPMAATLTPNGVTFTRTDTGSSVTTAEPRALGGYFRFKSQSTTGTIEIRNVRVDPA